MKRWIVVALVCIGCTKTPEPRSTCSTAFQHLYANPQSEWLVAFGYKDARPARFVGDTYERLLLIQKIVGPCLTPEDRACEFERDQDDGNLFYRYIQGPQNEKHQIRLHIIESSVGPDDDENRKDPFQRTKSASAQSMFLSALEGADIVLYNGHSRNGGGPDFHPPRITKSRHTDYSFYRKKKRAFQSIVNILGKGPNRVKLIGFFSCESKRWFSASIRRVAPRVSTIGFKGLFYYSHALEELIRTLDNLLSMRCDFERSDLVLDNF